jgi:hypothetical protein
LHLKNNGLTTLPAGIFDGLAALTRISLGDNPFEELPPNLFSGLCRLDGLYLDGTISPEVFADSTFGGKTLCGALRLKSYDGVSNAIETLEACEEQADDDACAYCGVSQSSCIAIGCGEGEQLTADFEACEACPAGTYNDKANNVWECAGCAAGKFGEVVGLMSADDCEDCAAGKATSGTMATSVAECLDCPAGRYSSAGGEACSMCAAGKSSEVVGSVSADDCAECEEGKASSEGSTACGVTVTGCVWSIFIGKFGGGDYINLSEVQAFDASGALIQPFGAQMYSMWSMQFPAANCVDGKLDFAWDQHGEGCHSLGHGPLEYLRVDYAGDVAALRSIVVTNRNDGCGELCDQRIVGSAMHVGPGQPTALADAAAAALWTAAFEASQATYSFETPALSCPAQG